MTGAEAGMETPYVHRLRDTSDGAGECEGRIEHCLEVWERRGGRHRWFCLALLLLAVWQLLCPEGTEQGPSARVPPPPPIARYRDTPRRDPDRAEMGPTDAAAAQLLSPPPTPPPPPPATRTHVGPEDCPIGLDVMNTPKEIRWVVWDDPTCKSGCRLRPCAPVRPTPCCIKPRDSSNALMMAFEKIGGKRVLFEGDARADGSRIESQSHILLNHWRLVKGLRVFHLGAIEPSLQKVGRRLPRGYQVDVVVRHSWPPNLAPPGEHCGNACRVILMLPFQYSVLPTAWLAPIRAHVTELWAPSRANANAIIASGIESSKVHVLTNGVDCSTILSNAAPEPSPVFRFVFTGAMLPRTGIDALLAAWEATLCANGNATHPQLAEGVQLLLHTSPGVGFSQAEMKGFEGVVAKCRNIVWQKAFDSERGTRKLRARTDAYVAPTRAASFGHEVLEAMAQKIPVLATVSADRTAPGAMDDFVDSVLGYPISSTRQLCQRSPCEPTANKLCIFGECTDEDTCTCEPMATEPTWLEPNLVEFGLQLVRVVEDGAQHRAQRTELALSKARTYCWSKVHKHFIPRLLATKS